MSTFQVKELQLKDQRVYKIRPLLEADSAAMLGLERVLTVAKEGVVKYEDELADEATYTTQLKTYFEGGALCIVATRDGVLVGEASLRRFSFRMLRHVGILALGVHPSAQGIGLGRALFESLILWARESEKLLRLELYVRADNAHAIKLYKSLGFEIEGTRRKFIRAADGSMIDDYVMGLLL
jgi:ribosomal protein S18 acetylase RimI-like enzyme